MVCVMVCVMYGSAERAPYLIRYETRVPGGRAR